MKAITTHHNHSFDLDALVPLMDNNIREELSSAMAGSCTQQEFYNAYADAHFTKFNETWEPEEANPQI